MPRLKHVCGKFGASRCTSSSRATAWAVCPPRSNERIIQILCRRVRSLVQRLFEFRDRLRVRCGVLVEGLPSVPVSLKQVPGVAAALDTQRGPQSPSALPQATRMRTILLPSKQPAVWPHLFAASSALCPPRSIRHGAWSQMPDRGLRAEGSESRAP